MRAELGQRVLPLSTRPRLANVEPFCASDDIEFRGGYTLTIFDMGAKYAGTKMDPEGKTTTLKGRVTCSVG